MQLAVPVLLLPLLGLATGYDYFATQAMSSSHFIIK